MKNLTHIVSFSGGKDSTAMLLLMLENGMQVDEAVMCDLGMEYPEMYKHIAKVEANTGIKITILKPEKSFIYWFAIHFRRKGKNPNEFYYDELGDKQPVRKNGYHSSDIFVDTKTGYGWPDMGNRWCTSLKAATINKYLKGKEVIEYHGIAADEISRTLNNKGRNIQYPLVDFGMTEKDCLEHCYYKGYTWDGLYKQMTRVSCYCCPLQNMRQLTYLYNERPELWANIQFLDSQSFRKFKPGKNLNQVEYKIRSKRQQLSLFARHSTKV